MNEHRFVVSDVLWQRLEQHLPGKIGDAGSTAKDNRLFPSGYALGLRGATYPLHLGIGIASFDDFVGGLNPAYLRVFSKR